jgi:hypothetical protein
MNTLFLAVSVLLASTRPVLCWASSSRASRVSGGSLRMSSKVGSEVIITRDLVESTFGLTRPDLLAEDFRCIGPSFELNREQYLKTLSVQASALRRAAPNLVPAADDLTIDPLDSARVWIRTRPSGTLTGPLSYNGQVFLPNGRSVEFPVTMLSASVTPEGQVSRLTAGYIIDRLSGNTGGQLGSAGLLEVLDAGLNPLWTTPPLVLLRRLVARTRQVRHSRAELIRCSTNAGCRTISERLQLFPSPRQLCSLSRNR